LCPVLRSATCLAGENVRETRVIPVCVARKAAFREPATQFLISDRSLQHVHDNSGVIGANSFQETTPNMPGCVAQECLPTAPGCTPSVPEPGTLALIGVSPLAGLAFTRRRTYRIV
jgi:hypothetical protein